MSSVPARGSLRHVFRRAGPLLAVVVLLSALAGCGWLGASSVSHRKPDAFVLRGRVTVAVPAGDSRPDGAACAATVPDLTAGTTVKISRPDGKLLAIGYLGDGVIARDGTGSSCEFPFQIAGVPGGVDAYDIAVGSRAPTRFAAKDLRENADAIILITG
jgi:hypothetical protein